MTDLTEALRLVARNRKAVRQMAEEMESANAEMCATPEGMAYLAYKTAHAELKAQSASAEAEARQAIISAYEASGNKSPAPGAGIRVKPVPVYDIARATEWAQRFAPALLVLDTKTFEKANLPGAPIEWTETPTATLATDLSMYEEN